MSEHVVLVALTVDADSREVAEFFVSNNLPRPGTDQITSWWIAEDDRHDGSDNDSAVFVEKGRQIEAHDILATAGLTAGYNYPPGGLT